MEIQTLHHKITLAPANLSLLPIEPACLPASMYVRTHARTHTPTTLKQYCRYGEGRGSVSCAGTAACKTTNLSDPYLASVMMITMMMCLVLILTVNLGTEHTDTRGEAGFWRMRASGEKE